MLGVNDAGEVPKPSWCEHPSQAHELDSIIGWANLLRCYVLPLTLAASGVLYIPAFLTTLGPGVGAVLAFLWWRARGKNKDKEMGGSRGRVM